MSPETDPIPTILSVGALLARRRTPPARRLVEALAEHIRRTGLYPPLIVRARARRRFEIIDGHARLAALKRLGLDEARCEIWPADDATADLLESSLNVLRGRRDAERSRPLLKRLIDRFGKATVALLLGMTPRGLGQKIAADGPLPPPPRPESVLPLHPVTFHLTDAQRGRLETALRGVSIGPRGSADAADRPPRKGTPKRNAPRLGERPQSTDKAIGDLDPKRGVGSCPTTDPRLLCSAKRCAEHGPAGADTRPPARSTAPPGRVGLDPEEKTPVAEPNLRLPTGARAQALMRLVEEAAR